MTTLQDTGLADLLNQARANENMNTSLEANYAADAPLQGLPGGEPLQQPPYASQPAPVHHGAPAEAPVVATATPAAQAVPPGAIEVILSEPISAQNGHLIDAIYLRPPTFGDWLDCGDLMQTIAMNGDGSDPEIRVSVDPRAAMRWFTRLSGQQLRFFRAMPLQDWKIVLAHLQQLVGDVANENPMM